jgi:hypothetical protein
VTTEADDLRRRVAELESEVGEAVAARTLAEQRALETEAALHAAYDTLGLVMDPTFASTFQDARRPEVRRLRRRIKRLRHRNERLRARNEGLADELARLQSSWAVRWSSALRRAPGLGGRPTG